MTHTSRTTAHSPLLLGFVALITVSALGCFSPLPGYGGASASSADPHHQSDYASDGDTSTAWLAEQSARSGWVELNLPEPARIQRLWAMEGPRDSVRRFQLQAEVDGRWQFLTGGGFIGKGRILSFDPVLTRKIRLVLCEADGPPSIAELRVYP